jgi:apolipoprotein N-acyltransferase
VAQVPVRNVTTIYSMVGRWFEWICLGGFLFALAWVLVARRTTE